MAHETIRNSVYWYKKCMTFALQLNRNGHRDIFIDHIISMDEQNVALLLIYFGQQKKIRKWAKSTTYNLKISSFNKALVFYLMNKF